MPYFHVTRKKLSLCHPQFTFSYIGVLPKRHTCAFTFYKSSTPVFRSATSHTRLVLPTFSSANPKLIDQVRNNNRSFFFITAKSSFRSRQRACNFIVIGHLYHNKKKKKKKKSKTENMAGRFYVKRNSDFFLIVIS